MVRAQPALAPLAPLLVLLVALGACGAEGAASDGGQADLATTMRTDGGTAPVDLLPRPPGIACGANTCVAMAQICCTKDNGLTGDCQYLQQMSCGSSMFLCDGPEDCPPAEPECCATGGTAQCGSTGACTGAPLCHRDQDCALGTRCCPAPNGSPYALCLKMCP